MKYGITIQQTFLLLATELNKRKDTNKMAVFNAICELLIGTISIYFSNIFKSNPKRFLIRIQTGLIIVFNNQQISLTVDPNTQRMLFCNLITGIVFISCSILEAISNSSSFLKRIFCKKK